MLFIAERLGAEVGEMLEGYDIAAYIKEDRTYISARWVAEQLGA